MGEIIHRKKIYRHKVALLCLFIGCIALIATFISSDMESIKIFVTLIGPTIVVACILGILYEYFLRSEIIAMNDMSAEKVIEKFDISKNCELMGLTGLGYDASEEDFDDLLFNQKNVTIILNDGRTWISHRSVKIKKRINNKRQKTTFILIDPESDFLHSLAIKLGVTNEILKAKILETHKMLREMSGKNKNLEVYGHSLPTSQSIFMCEDYAYSAPYPMATKMDHIPIYKYSKFGNEPVYEGISNDIMELQKLSRLIFKV